MRHVMKERKELFGRIQNNSAMAEALAADAMEFEKMVGSHITNHAYDMHGVCNLDAVRHNEIVSFFDSGKKKLTGCVRATVRSAKTGIMNFLADSRSDTLELVRCFKDVVGVVLTDDDSIETRWVKVIICKDDYGKLFVKTAYPILGKEVM